MTTTTTSAPQRSALDSVRIDTPLTSYYLVLSATCLLVALGLVMVFSSSSVASYRATHSSFTIFSRQAMFAAMGIPLLWAATRLPVRAWKALGWVLLIGATLAELAVFSPLGKVVQGNRNWLVLGPVQIQPSEAIKLALVVWGAAVLARKRPLLDRWVHVFVPVIPVAVVLLGLVMFGHDLGTTLVLLAIVVGMLYVAGAPGRVFAAAGAVVAVVLTLAVTTSGNRMARIGGWIGGSCDYHSTCWQATHGKWALASGGWWGVGLGASREKWGALPEAQNDFIFAIIGEELGLPGTLVVLALYAALGVACLRVVRRSDDIFVKVATGGVMIWVLGQAVINIGAVLGVLPVIGVPLPLVSSGGSALVTTMIALGMVISFAREEPGAREALSARAGIVRRGLAVVPGRRLAARAGHVRALASRR